MEKLELKCLYPIEELMTPKQENKNLSAEEKAMSRN